VKWEALRDFLFSDEASSVIAQNKKDFKL